MLSCPYRSCLVAKGRGILWLGPEDVPGAPSVYTTTLIVIHPASDIIGLIGRSAKSPPEFAATESCPPASGPRRCSQDSNRGAIDHPG
jgi:hypothetical protein